MAVAVMPTSFLLVTAVQHAGCHVFPHGHDYLRRRSDPTFILPIIAAKASPIIILPTMDLKSHLLDVFIKSLRSWIDSNRLIGVNL